MISPTPSGPVEGYAECRGCFPSPSGRIAYYPPLFTRAVSTVRSEKGKPSRLLLFTAAVSPQLHAENMDNRVEYIGKAARQRPSSAPAHISAPAHGGRAKRIDRSGAQLCVDTPRSRNPSATSRTELSWRIDEAPKPAPHTCHQKVFPSPRRREHGITEFEYSARDVNARERRRLSLMSSRATVKLSGMETVKQLEIEGRYETKIMAREAEKEALREGMAAKQKLFKETVNFGVEERSRYLAHVPPGSPTSKLAVLEPDLYNKWTPRTAAVAYSEGLTKRAMPAPVVMAVVSLTMTPTDFTEQKQASFKKAIADSAGVKPDEVIIDRISGSLRIDLSITARDDGEASKICSQLVIETINIKLNLQGLPKATLAEKPSVQHPGYCVIDFLTNTMNFATEHVSAICPKMLACGFTTRRKIFAMTEEDLESCRIPEKQKELLLHKIQQGDDQRKKYTKRMIAEGGSTPLPKSDAFVNMKKAIGQIKSRDPPSSFYDTVKLERLKHLELGDKAVVEAHKALANENKTLAEVLLDARTHRDAAANEYASATSDEVKQLDRKLSEIKHELEVAPSSFIKHRIKEEAAQVKSALLRDGLTLDYTKKKMDSLDAAIAYTEFTVRAVEEFELREGASIVDKMERIQEEIAQANSKTLQAATAAALENVKLLHRIEVAASAAASSAAFIQERQEHDLKIHYRQLKERFKATNNLRVVNIVQKPCLESEQKVKNIWSGSGSAATDLIVAVLLHQLEEQRDAARQNEMELAKVRKWCGFEDQPDAKTGAKDAKNAKQSVASRGAQEVSPPGPNDPKPTSVAWDDNKVDLKTHISNFFRGIGVYNSALALEMCDRVYPHLNAAGVGAAMAGAVRAVLRQVDERIEGAKNDEKKLEEIPLSDEEEEKAEAERREAEAEEEEEAAKEEVGKDKNKRIPTVLRDGSSRQLAPKRREPTEFERKQRLEEKEKKAKEEAKRRASIALIFPREKLWQIDFRFVKPLDLYSFTEEHIKKARQNERVLRAEEQVLSAHANIAVGLEGILEGSRILYKKEKAARAAAAAVSEAQNERVSQFAKQIQDLQAQILHEPQDQTVLALKSELQKVCKDVKDINAIFCKIGGCPGPYVNDSSLHCCAHTVHDPACRKWMKKGDKFQCCAGKHWVCVRDHRLFKAKT